ncbi:hypothetical protein HJFPF1_12699 [Paramyrothecium foliicola]|nr:hypothetical protein HJFPF1_12699 [Paramyrothecium foliicola]
MRLPWALLLGAIVGAQAQQIVERQDESSSAPASEPATSSAPPPETSSSAPPASTSSSGGDDDDDDVDTTVFQTVTVTNNDVETVSSVTTVFTTSTTTVVVTITEFETTTVTGNEETSTTTVIETSTHWVEKRAIDLAPRTLDADDGLAAAPALYTTIPHDFAAVAHPLPGAHELAKRATVTQATTVTVDGDGDATTVLSTVRRQVITTEESSTTSVSVITSTVQANARTTVTTTSTLVVTSTSVSSGGIRTTDADPESSSDANPDNNSGSSGGGGLSTGAKAGIGAGVGVAGLIIIGALIWFCVKRRRTTKAEHDDLIGASEVPVGGPVGSGHTPSTTAHHSAAAAFLAPNRTSTKPSHSPEGYRGTAMGDGRAGFAKPAPYGSAYAGAGAVSPVTAYSQPTDYSHQPTDRSSTLVSHSPDGLPEHPTPQSAVAEMDQGGHAGRWHDANAAEIDSRPAMSHQSGPVYEMPSQSYR